MTYRNQYPEVERNDARKKAASAKASSTRASLSTTAEANTPAEEAASQKVDYNNSLRLALGLKASLLMVAHIKVPQRTSIGEFSYKYEN